VSLTMRSESNQFSEEYVGKCAFTYAISKKGVSSGQTCEDMSQVLEFVFWDVEGLSCFARQPIAGRSRL
jgi:hypothetical protein